MVEPVGKNQVLPADQGRNDAGIGGIPRIEHQCGLGPLEGGDACFQGLVEFHVTRNEPRSTASRPIALHCADGGFLQQGVIGQAEIVVGTEQDRLPSVKHNPASLRTLDKTHVPVKTLRAEFVELFVKCFQLCHFSLRLFRLDSLLPYISRVSQLISATWLTSSPKQPMMAHPSAAGTMNQFDNGHLRWRKKPDWWPPGAGTPAHVE